MINYYQIFGLNSDWDTDKIREELLKKFANSKLNLVEDGEISEQSQKYSQLLKEAVETLTDPDAKAHYDQQILQQKYLEDKVKTNLKNTVFTVEEIWDLIGDFDYSSAIIKAKELLSDNPKSDTIWQV